MNGFLFDVKKYRKDSRDELAKKLAELAPLNLTNGAGYSSLADLIAFTKKGRLVFSRSGGADLVFEWERHPHETSIWWKSNEDLTVGIPAAPAKQ